jgi:hypothetical protein
MKWAALVTWVITALGGFGLLAIWLQRGGMRQGDQPGRRIRPPMILGHMALAAAGLVVWIVYLADDKKGLAWAAFVVLLVVASIGFAMFALWLQRRQPARVGQLATAGGPSAALEGGAPAEQHFPIVIVGAHGLLAATTLVLVLLTAAGVGGS